jgi:serine/threonine-protein kinase
MLWRMTGLQAAPREGDVLDGRFRIDGLIGHGGFGAVYAATQLNLQRKVALKVLRPDLIATDESRARFRREAEMAQRLEHPNTVRLFDFGGADAGNPYMAFELLHGRGLDDIIAREGRQSEARVGRMGSQVLKSLMEAHDKGIVHRDIKPSNIFLCDFPGEPDFVKVLDFGIAKPTKGDVPTVTSDGQVLGSPSYMSPEQVRGDRVGPGSDLYSLGLVMAEMLTGRLVFSGPSAIQVLIDQVSEVPVPLAAEVSSSPLGPVIARATHKHASARFDSAQAMLWALEAALRTASNHPAAYRETLELGARPASNSLLYGATRAQVTPPLTTNPVTTTSAATVEAADAAQSTTIPLSRPKLGWVIATAVIASSLMAGLAGGVVVWVAQPPATPAAESAAAEPSREREDRKVRKEGTIDLAEQNPFTRGAAFKSLNIDKVRARAERAGWLVNGEPQTNIEGSFTTVNMVLTREGKAAVVVLLIADDDRVADAVVASALEQEDVVALRDGTGALTVAVKGNRAAAEALLKVLAAK